jgi:hypothetical protein
MSLDGWIAVDLDGTLAHYEGGPLLPIGKPVPLMVERVKRWLLTGIEVRIFTARISDPDRRTRAKVVEAIDAWCEAHIGQRLQVTNVKDFSMRELWDDRAVQVEPNTGRVVNEFAFFSPGVPNSEE